MYRYAKRPDELLSYLNKIDKMELKKGEKQKLTLILTISNGYFDSEIQSNLNGTRSSRDSRDFSYGEIRLSFHCFSSFPSIQIADQGLTVHFTTCQSRLSIDTTRLFINDIHIGRQYERKVKVTNLSPVTTTFTIQSIQDPSYLCFVFVPRNNTFE